MYELSLNTIGNFASVIGAILTVLGFGFTLFKIKKVRNAAESARQAAIETCRSIRRFDASVELASVVETIDEIKRLQRENSWKVVPDRYSTARKKLIMIKLHHPDLSNQHKRIIQSVIQHLENMESDIEKGLAKEENLPSVANLNILLSEQRDKIWELATELRIKTIV
ncbi:MAG: hypothetical protein GXO78_00920 [Calditrichaeota bacterium]|nr:hypothetical protein [Calditrichota bacterium]